MGHATTQAEVRSFISVIGYYRRFVDGFARVVQPLTDLLREGQFEFPMPQAAQAAMVELRSPKQPKPHKLLSSISRGFPIPFWY